MDLGETPQRKLEPDEIGQPTQGCDRQLGKTGRADVQLQELALNVTGYFQLGDRVYARHVLTAFEHMHPVLANKLHRGCVQ